MNDRNADTQSTWSTDLVEQVIKQPVRNAVREALVEQEVARTDTVATTAVSGTGDESATTEADEPSYATEAAADADSAPDRDGVDGEATTSSRSRGLSLALLAGSLVGVGYALAATGTLNMADLASTFGTGTVPYDSTLVVTAFGLMVGGLTVKVALFPLHTWQPDAYANAPDSVSAFISALVSTVSAYALARLLFSVFTVEFLTAVPAARWALIALASVSIVAGSALAVSQSNVQRMLAYSSVSQFGLVIAGFTIATPIAVVGATVHLVGHAVMKGGLFAATGIIERETGATTVGGYAGMGSRTPLAAGAFTLLALGMVGVPPMVGFVGKWNILVGAVNAEIWPVVAVLLASTLLTLAYFARLGERLYFAEATIREGDETAVADGGESVSFGMIAVVVIAAVLAVALTAAVPGLESLLDQTLPPLFNQ